MGGERLVTGFVPPDYPYDRLEGPKKLGSELPGGLVDLSVGTPTDPPPPAVMEALSGGAGKVAGADAAAVDAGGRARGYPPSIGTVELRSAIGAWISDRFGVELSSDQVAICVGTKEFVATTPQWLKLRTPERDTVLYPAISYPTYEMGSILAGLRPVRVATTGAGGLDLDSISDEDAGRALMLWVNSPANPTGALDDLAAAAEWGRRHGVPVFSDECYAEFTWSGPPTSLLQSGSTGVVAVHSLSKRSNLAGLRVGWYAGDADLVGYLREVRKHAGFMVPGPAQRAAVVALEDRAHVEQQRQRYHERLVRMREILASVGVEAPMPEGAFYLWAPVPDGDEWAWTDWFARKAGALVSPGSFYGPGGSGFVRLAAVAGMDRLDLIARRLGCP